MKMKLTQSVSKVYPMDRIRELPAERHSWKFFLGPPLWLPYLMALLFMFALKRHYSIAPAEHLQWILQPVGWLVGCWDGLPYAWHPGVGLVRSDGLITIAPSCAGVNFMIMAYGLSVIAFLHHQPTLARRTLWLVAALPAAFGTTVLVNTVRIILAIAFYDAAFAWGWLTPERLHIIAGIAVYAGALGLYYMVLHRIIAGNGPNFRSLRRLWLPWMWYVTGAVAVPAIHRAWLGHGWPGVEYCLIVVGISGLIFGTIRLGSATASLYRHRIRRERNKETPCVPES